MGTFFRLQVYERVGISLVKAYERIGESGISVCKKKKPKGLTDTFYGCKNVKKKRSGVVDINIFYNGVVTQVKGIQSSKLCMCKGYHLSIEGIQMGYPTPLPPKEIPWVIHGQIGHF